MALLQILHFPLFLSLSLSLSLSEIQLGLCCFSTQLK